MDNDAKESPIFPTTTAKANNLSLETINQIIYLIIPYLSLTSLLELTCLCRGMCQQINLPLNTPSQQNHIATIFFNTLYRYRRSCLRQTSSSRIDLVSPLNISLQPFANVRELLESRCSIQFSTARGGGEWRGAVSLSVTYRDALLLVSFVNGDFGYTLACQRVDQQALAHSLWKIVVNIKDVQDLIHFLRCIPDKLETSRILPHFTVFYTVILRAKYALVV